MNSQPRKPFAALVAIISLSVVVLATKSLILGLLGVCVYLALLELKRRKERQARSKFAKAYSLGVVSTDAEGIRASCDEAFLGASDDSKRSLTGHQLLEKVNELGDISKSELVRACGYVSIESDGGERLDFTAFYEALLEAKGISLTATSESGGEYAESVEAGTLSEEQSSSKDWTGLSNDQIVVKIQSSADVDVDTLEKLIEINYWRIREAIALHPGTPDVVIRQLLEDADADVRSAVARRDLPSPWCSMGKDLLLQSLRTESAPSSVLERLAKSEDGFTRVAVASNPSISVAILESLQDDSSREVRRVVGKQLLAQKIPEEWKLLDDDQRIERLNEETVAVEVLEFLAISSNWQIRQAVAGNRSVNEEILDRLKDDDDSDVASAARDGLLSLKLPQEWRVLDDDQRIERLDEDTVAVEVLELLAISSNWQIRQAVARHQGTPDALLNQLAEDDDSDVKQAIEDRRLPLEWRQLDEDKRVRRIASMPVETEILEILATSPSTRVRQSVASTTRTPVGVLEKLSQDNSYEVRETAENSLEQQELPEEWKLLSESQKVKRLSTQIAGTEALEVLALSRSPRIREAVARNRNSSIKIILRMKEDSATASRIERLIRTTWGTPPQERDAQE